MDLKTVSKMIEESASKAATESANQREQITEACALASTQAAASASAEIVLLKLKLDSNVEGMESIFETVLRSMPSLPPPLVPLRLADM